MTDEINDAGERRAEEYRRAAYGPDHRTERRAGGGREDGALTVSRRPVPLATILTVFAVAIALAAAWKLSFVLLMGFAAILIAVALYNASALISHYIPIHRLLALALLLLSLTGAVTALAMATGPRVGEEFAQLIRSIPEAAQKVQSWFEETTLGELVDEEIGILPSGDGERDSSDSNSSSDSRSSNGSGSDSNNNRGNDAARAAAERMPDIVSALTWTVNAIINGILNMVVVLAIAIFLAIDPRPYVQGFLHMVPRRHRPRAGEVIEEIGTKMWLWLAGQFIDMIIVGTLIGLGLWMLDIPLALVLGVIAAATNIVPFIGPIVSAVPGILFALTQGPQDALYAGILYLVVQQFDGNVLTPLIQKHTARLPPVLTVLGVVAFGVLFGLPGILVATPLMLVVLICVKRFYVEDLLGDDLQDTDEKKDGEPAAREVSPAEEGVKMS
ncbi:MAG: AI-2E family transporter [Paracoccus sp. (in: a-proteobacteria)]|nr:AI-2E family transporter [Paracoccus sp. (in: a-proteobacteria)]